MFKILKQVKDSQDFKDISRTIPKKTIREKSNTNETLYASNQNLGKLGIDHPQLLLYTYQKYLFTCKILTIFSELGTEFAASACVSSV